MRILALDSEDDSEGVPHLINFYDGRTHRTFERSDPKQSVSAFQAEAWNYLYAQQPCTVWICNAEYDLINLFGRWLGKMVTLQYVSSGLLKGISRDAHVTFYDTLRHWPMSVEQMGAYLHLPKLDYDFTTARTPWAQMGPVERDRLRTYCRRDTEIVHRFVTEMLGRYASMDLDVKATLPSMALQLFHKQFYRKPFTPLPPPITEWLRNGYYGGRVEVYRFGEIPGPIRHYDVNSLFPSVMVSGTYPNPATYREVTEARGPRRYAMNLDREGMADVTLHVPMMEYPPLPVRGGTDILYPWGELSGVWTYPEIRQALADGATIETLRHAVEFQPMPTPFKDYILFCYAQRIAAPKHSLDDVLWKLYMNSLYGKFGQRAGLEMIYDDRQITLKTKPSAAANVVWAAYVTALARVRLLGFLRSTGECFYTDTDSLFTHAVLPTSPDLGALKLEGEYDSMEAVGNKMYAWHREAHGPLTGRGRCSLCGRLPDEPCAQYKAKGVPKKVAEDFIRQGRAVYRKPARFRESRRTGATMNRWYEVPKVRRAEYTKRRMLADGRTEPWEWRAYQVMADLR